MWIERCTDGGERPPRRRADEHFGNQGPRPAARPTGRVARGSVLDFGAGRGELIGKLVNLGRFTTVSGADILERPTGLPETVNWYCQDLNEEISTEGPFDAVICSEVIEHLENPRATFRALYKLLRPGGTLILTMPNQESIRSYGALLFGGHFVEFLDTRYPAHITALLRADLNRICTETRFTCCRFVYTNVGGSRSCHGNGSGSKFLSGYSAVGSSATTSRWWLGSCNKRTDPYKT